MPADVSSQPGGAGTQRTATGPTQSRDRHAPNFEPTDDEKKVVDSWLQRVQRAQTHAPTKQWRDDLEKLRRYERGAQTVDDKKSSTNMIYATLAAMMPELYAKNPTIAVSPTDAVGRAELAKVKRFCATAEKVIRKMLVEEGKLKKRAKANIRSAFVTGYGALKVIYQKGYRGDPVVVRRIEDTQDNLARIEELIADMRKETDPAQLAVKRDQLQANLKALASGNEVQFYKGFVVDRIRSEDFLILDDNVAEFDEYVDASALGHQIWMRVGDAKVLFKTDLHGATKYGTPRSDANAKAPDDAPPDDLYICVVEIWDKANGVVRTVAKGMNRWLREPYTPEYVPQRWYPFYLLGFNLTEGQWRPLSDTEMLCGLQEEYDRTRKNYADARENSVPKRIVRKGGNLSEQDVENIIHSSNKEWVAVEGNPQVPINQDVMQLEGIKIDPQAYDVSIIRNDMDIVSGRSDASRANLIKPKTATEAEIMAEAMQSRVGERRDTNEDLLSEMGEGALEVALQDLTVDEVKQLAGPEAEWPSTPQGAEEVFRMVSVKVRAGSSGRPNMQREREQWQALMPVIKETMTSVTELRAAGQFELAEAQLELLRETLRRFDEYLDLDSLIPPLERDENGQPVAQQQAAAELVKAKEQLGAAGEQVQALTEENTKLKAGEESKLAQTAANERLEKDRAAADADLQRFKALLAAAVEVQKTEIQAAATANADDAAKRDEAMKAAASEERLSQIMQDLQKTLEGLGSAIERVGAKQPQGAGDA